MALKLCFGVYIYKSSCWLTSMILNIVQPPEHRTFLASKLVVDETSQFSHWWMQSWQRKKVSSCKTILASGRWVALMNLGLFTVRLSIHYTICARKRAIFLLLYFLWENVTQRKELLHSLTDFTLLVIPGLWWCIECEVLWCTPSSSHIRTTFKVYLVLSAEVHT